MKTTRTRHAAILVLSLLGLSFGGEPAAGAVAAGPPTGDLPERIRAAKTRFDPVVERDMDEAREALRIAANRLDRRLSREGANGRAWRQYVRFALLEGELAKGTGADSQRLRQVHERLVGKHEGLERAVFTDVRDAIAEYAQVLDDRAAPDLRNEYESHLEALAGAVETYSNRSDASAREQIAGHLGWLDRRGRAPSVVRAVRERLSHDNFVLRVSRKVIAAYVGSTIDETAPVHDVILGTTICGTGRTVGSITASLVPDDERGLAHVEMDATNYSRTVGYRRAVKSYQNHRTRLLGSKPVIIDGNGLRSLPAEAAASTRSCMTGMTTTHRSRLRDTLTLRVARRQSEKQQWSADRIAESRQRLRIRRRLDQQVEAQLAEGNKELNERFFHPLVRYGAFPRRFVTQTDRNQLLVRLEEAGAGQLGAPAAPPSFVEDTDLALHVHGSAVENLAAAALGGKTITAERMSEMVGAFRSGAPETDTRSSAEDVSVVLAGDKPLTVSIGEGVIALTVHGRQYVARGRGYPAMDVTVRYAIERADGGLRAVLVGEPEFVPPRFAEGGSQRFSAREAALRRLLKARLDRDLDKEISCDGVKMGGKLSALGELSIVQLAAEDGWLTLACRQP